MYRIWRSPYSAFGKHSRTGNDLHDETVTANEAYSEEALENIANSGFNAIWVHGLLHHLVPAEEFPEFGANSDIHLQNMRALIGRAAKYDIKVFIYMQPPRAIALDNKAFWDNHADVAGQIEELPGDGDSATFKVQAICTSTPIVKTYLKKAAARLAEELPELGGVIMITASEYPAHCYSRRGSVTGAMGEVYKMPIECPRCKDRKPEDVVVELIGLIRDGIRSVSESQEIITWNWSWSFYVDAPCEEIISRLPKDVIMMAGFERGGRKDVLGHKDHKIDEYSISYAGPSEQFKESYELAEKCGLRTMAKLQFGTTHELADVVSLPLLGNIFKKADFLRRNRLAGFMGCWNFGNMISANTAGFNYFLTDECPADEYNALKSFAEKYLPGVDGEKMVEVWKIFNSGMNSYPFGIPYLYAGPTNFALAHTSITVPGPLTGKTAGRSWLLDERGDDLSGAINEFTLDEIISGFDQLSSEWQKGVDLFKEAMNGVDGETALDEFGNAVICGGAWRSTRNSFKFYKLRLDWNDEKLAEFKEIAADELANLHKVLPFVERDSRQGYHSEAHGYMFNAEMIREKITALEKVLS